MKTQIRKNVFETNSSSMHSLTLSQSNDNRIDLPNLFHGKLLIGVEGETYFGWQVQDYNDVDSKLNYFLASNETSKYDYEDKLEIIADFLNISTKDIIFNAYSVSIDHNSCDLLYTAFTNKDEVLNFLFDPNSIIHCDNDNH